LGADVVVIWVTWTGAKQIVKNIFSVTLILAFSFLSVGCTRSKEPRAIQNDLPRFPGPIAAAAFPKIVPLTAPTLEQFLDLAQRIPQARTDLIKQQVAAASGDAEVISALSKKLLELPVKNVDRHLMILAVMGETQDPRFIEPLKSLIWTKEKVVLQSTGQGKAGSEVSFFNHDPALKARAAEMLAYIATPEAFSATRDIIGKHPSIEVRTSAMDAYLYNHGDSAAAKAELARLVSANDARLIGIPRKTRDMNVQEFDNQLQAFYDRYPEEKPPVPQRVKPDVDHAKESVTSKAVVHIPSK